MKKPIWVEKTETHLQKNLLVWTVVFMLIMLAILLFPFVRNSMNSIGTKERSDFGQFVGGYFGTAFSLIGVILLYLTFKSQRESSESQRESSESQRESSEIEKFENKYFELIKMHRENVAEIKLGRETGKKAFVLLTREFREILEKVKHTAEHTSQFFTQKQVFIISYYCLYYGVGPNSSRMLKDSLNSLKIRNSGYPNFVNEIEKSLNNQEEKLRVKDKREFGYTPFEGHQHRLAHYYRHLYQSVSYVHKQIIKIDKYDYIKTIRGQLTNHEQALFFINSLTPLAKDWWEIKQGEKDSMIMEYKFVRNIPRGFFDVESEINLSDYFNDDYFEWYENN